MEAMARSVGEEGQHESAIAWMERALEAFYRTHNSPGIDAFLISYIADWKEKLGDHAGALETAKMFVPLNKTPQNDRQAPSLTAFAQGMGKAPI